MLLLQFLQLCKRLFFLLQLGPILLLEIGPFHHIMVESFAQSVARSHVLHPHVDFRLLSFHAARPEAIHQHTVAVFFAGFFIDSFDAYHWGSSLQKLEDLIVDFSIRADELPRVNRDRKSTRLNSSHRCISYAVFCLKKKNKQYAHNRTLWHMMNKIENYENRGRIDTLTLDDYQKKTAQGDGHQQLAHLFAMHGQTPQ